MSIEGDTGPLHFFAGKKAIIEAGFKNTVCYYNITIIVFDKYSIQTSG